MSFWTKKNLKQFRKLSLEQLLLVCLGEYMKKLLKIPPKLLEKWIKRLLEWFLRELLERFLEEFLEKSVEDFLNKTLKNICRYPSGGILSRIFINKTGIGSRTGWRSHKNVPVLHSCGAPMCTCEKIILEIDRESNKNEKIWKCFSGHFSIDLHVKHIVSSQ